MGWSMKLKDLLRSGEAIFNLKRLINIRRGITARDDSLPRRLLEHKRPDVPEENPYFVLWDVVTEME